MQAIPNFCFTAAICQPAFPDEILGQQDWLSLSATTMELDDLSVGLDAATLLTLSAETPILKFPAGSRNRGNSG